MPANYSPRFVRKPPISPHSTIDESGRADT